MEHVISENCNYACIPVCNYACIPFYSVALQILKSPFQSDAIINTQLIGRCLALSNQKLINWPFKAQKHLKMCKMGYLWIWWILILQTFLLSRPYPSLSRNWVLSKKSIFWVDFRRFENSSKIATCKQTEVFNYLFVL